MGVKDQRSGKRKNDQVANPTKAEKDKRIKDQGNYKFKYIDEILDAFIIK